MNNTLRTQSIPAPRGLIFDRNIEVIAENKPKFQLEMVPEQVNKLESSLLYLTELGILDENEISTIEQELEETINSKYCH